MIENILSGLAAHVACGYYRTAGGGEIDLILDMGGGEMWAVEIKRSTAPRVSRGFRSACEDVGPTRRLVVHGGRRQLPAARWGGSDQSGGCVRRGEGARGELMGAG